MKASASLRDKFGEAILQGCGKITARLKGGAPLKVIDFDEAVNVTLGLPYVRTSPDHGTAFGIAGQGKASPRSFANAVTVARRLIKSRTGQ